MKRMALQTQETNKQEAYSYTCLLQHELGKKKNKHDMSSNSLKPKGRKSHDVLRAKYMYTITKNTMQSNCYVNPFQNNRLAVKPGLTGNVIRNE